MLKKTLLFFAFIFSITAFAQDKGEFKFESTFHDFGDIKAGEKVETVYKFTNSGTRKIYIKRVITPCGCTAPEWPKEEIKPGGSAEVKVVFDSTGKSGIQRKTLYVVNNIEQEIILQFKANVLLNSE